MRVEAAVGPHSELPPGPSVAHSPHRLTQAVGASRSRDQHVAGSGGDGQQRVIAPGAGVAMVSRGLADGGIQVDGERPVAGSGAQPPCPGQQLAAHPVQLADMAPPEAAQEGPQGGGRLDHAAERASRPAGAQHVGVVEKQSCRGDSLHFQPEIAGGGRQRRFGYGRDCSVAASFGCSLFPAEEHLFANQILRGGPKRTVGIPVFELVVAL